MIEKAPSVTTYLEQARLKGEQFNATGEIESDIVANLGQVPNLDEILSAISGREGRFDHQFKLPLPHNEEPVAIPQNEQDSTNVFDTETAVTVFRPLLDTLEEDYRTRFGVSNDTALMADIGGHYRLIEPKHELSDVERPHVDGLQGSPAGSFGYLACLGPSTTYWKGKFDINAMFEAAHNAEPTDYFADSDELERQIRESSIPMIPLPDNSVIATDSHIVHSAPTGNPELAGQQRGIIMVNFTIIDS